MPITFAVKIDHCQSVDLGLHSRSQLRVNRTVFYLQYLGHYLSYTFKFGMMVDFYGCHNSMLMLVSTTVIQGHSGSAKQTKSALNALGN